MYISNEGPATDMPRGITYIGSIGADNLIDFEQEQQLSGWFKKLRKMRPSKWKPKQFVKAAAIVGGAVLLGPAAAALAAKGAREGAGLISRQAPKAFTAASDAMKRPVPTLAKDFSRFASPNPPFPPNATPDELKYTGTEPAGPPSPSSSGMLIPLLAVGALLMLSKNRK